MTRDSWIWWAGIVVAIVMGLATLQTGNPTSPLSLGYYGIPDMAAPYIRLVAYIIGIVSGKLATSPLPHSKET